MSVIDSEISKSLCGEELWKHLSTLKIFNTQENGLKMHENTTI